MIELKAISKYYKIAEASIPVLKNIDLNITPNEFAAIVGPSGSGKSTLMNILGLLDKPTSGHYFFEGQDLTDLRDNDFAKFRSLYIGFIFQSFMLLPNINLLENIALPLYYQNLPEKLCEQKSHTILAKVGLASFANRKPSELSGGQQQRVAIARALVTEPKIILADEPTGSLDSRTGQEIFNLLARLNEEEKTTIIIVTHDALIAKQCKRIIRIHDGRLVTEDK
jgi:putative ABC transport system ATP-binding protein